MKVVGLESIVLREFLSFYEVNSIGLAVHGGGWKRAHYSSPASEA